MGDLKRLAPNVSFVADEGVSQLRLLSHKAIVLTGSRGTEEQMRQTIEQIESESDTPIWDELSVRYEEELVR